MKLVLDLTLTHHNLSDFSLVSCFILQCDQWSDAVCNTYQLHCTKILCNVDLLSSRQDCVRDYCIAKKQ